MANASTSSHSNLEKLKRSLSQRAEQLRADLQKVDGQLQAVTITITLLGKEVADTEIEVPEKVKGLQGLTQVEALIKIALDSGVNRVRIREAKKTLLAAGLIKTKKNANAILFTTIHRSGKFRRVAPGEYEVILKPVIATASGSIESIKRVG